MKDNQDKSSWHKLLWSEIEDDEFQFWLDQTLKHRVTPKHGWAKRFIIYLGIIFLIRLISSFIFRADYSQIEKDSLAVILLIAPLTIIIAVEITLRIKYFVTWLNKLSKDDRHLYLSIIKRKQKRAFQLIMYSLLGTVLFCAVIYAVYLIYT